MPRTSSSSLPAPHAGLVIRYSYLWHSQHLAGREEGVKDRPCAIILVTTRDNDDDLVTVLPITHRQPSDPLHAVAIPAATCKRLGLDDMRQWIILTEANRFVWPGPDLRFGAGGKRDRVDFGFLPASLYREMRDTFLALARRTPPPMPMRTE